MLRKFVLPALGLMVLPAFASAQFEAGNWELTLNGGGSVNNATTADDFSGTLGVGYFATKELEVGVRQALAHHSQRDASHEGAFSLNSDGQFEQVTQNKGEGWSGVTVAAADYHLDLGRFQPFVGVFGGYQYTNLDRFSINLEDGSRSKIHDSSWIAGPEVGLKYFVNGTTFVFARTAYNYWFADNNNSSFTVDLGIGFRF
jgi:outer membrane protein W